MDYKILGLRIKKYRQKNKITQEQLGEKLNKSGSTIKRYEKGEVEPSLIILEKMADIFNVSLAELMGINDNYASEEFEILVAYNKLSSQSKYFIKSLLEIELYKQKKYKLKEKEKLTDEQQTELEELYKGII